MKFSPAAKAVFLATLSVLSPSMAFTPSAARAAARSSTAIRRQAFQPSSIRSASSVSASSLLVANAFTPSSAASNYRRNIALTALPLSLRGGTSSSSSASALNMSTAAAVEEAATELAPQEIFRSDYKPLPFKVSNVSMNFDIRDGKTVVER